MVVQRSPPEVLQALLNISTLDTIIVLQIPPLNIILNKCRAPPPPGCVCVWCPVMDLCPILPHIQSCRDLLQTHREQDKALSGNKWGYFLIASEEEVKLHPFFSPFPRHIAICYKKTPKKPQKTHTRTFSWWKWELYMLQNSWRCGKVYSETLDLPALLVSFH